MMTTFEKVVIELLIAILKGFYTNQFHYPYSDAAKAYGKYAESTIKMAEELIENDTPNIS